jgi:peptide/nickel transport system substrate-binding protein
VKWYLNTLLLVLIGCAPGVPAGEHGGNTLIVARANDSIGLDPWLESDNESMEVTEEVFEHLVRLTLDGTSIEPGLASSWDVSKDGTIWTFHLRQGVAFHDGTPLDADAVVFSFGKATGPESSAYFRAVKKVEALDSSTVRFTLVIPFAPFLTYLGVCQTAIVSPTAARKLGGEFSRHPVGTGPFRFVSWIPGKSVTLERNASYWGEQAKVDRIVYRVISDPRERLQAIESGSVDVNLDVLPEDLPVAALHPNLKVLRFASYNIAYVAMNTDRAPFDDARVRRAASHAVNRTALINLIYQGLAEATVGPVPPSMWGYNKDVETYEFDPAAARRLLSERPRPIDRVQFHVFDSARTYLPNPIEVGRRVQRNLADIGLDTELIVEDLPTFMVHLRKGTHAISLLGWNADVGDPDNFLYTLLDSDNAKQGSAMNASLYRNPEYHDLVIAAQRETDRDKRALLYRQAQEIVARDAPWIPLVQVPRIFLVRAPVEGVRFRADGWTDYASVRLVAR